MINNNADNNLCACGCGQPVEKGRKYLHGHNNRGVPSPKKVLPKGEPPLCECGCGNKVEWSDSRRRWNRFIKGHGKKGIPRSQEVKDKLSLKAKQRSDKIAEDNRRRVWSKESREKLSISKRNNLPPKHFKDGKLNPQYKHGNEYTRPSSSILLKHRAEIIDIRGFRCELCGAVPSKKNLLHMHHIDDNPFNNTTDNLQLLCIKCHNQITHPI